MWLELISELCTRCTRCSDCRQHPFWSWKLENIQDSNFDTDIFLGISSHCHHLLIWTLGYIKSYSHENWRPCLFLLIVSLTADDCILQPDIATCSDVPLKMDTSPFLCTRQIPAVSSRHPLFSWQILIHLKVTLLLFDESNGRRSTKYLVQENVFSMWSFA